LAELDDAPPFLWLMGDPALLAKPMIALVGARNASSLGTSMARSLAHDLGEAGFVVVSGLAVVSMPPHIWLPFPVAPSRPKRAVWI
jgi:DNA processing protein